MKEKYEPTPEEVNKAEERMTPSEKELSQRRDLFVEAGRGGKDNPFIAKERGRDLSDSYEGTIGGHRFQLNLNGNIMMGSVDGMALPPEEAFRLFNIYGVKAADEKRFRSSMQSLEDKARTEVAERVEGRKSDDLATVEQKRLTPDEAEKKQVENILRDLKEKGLI